MRSKHLVFLPPVSPDDDSYGLPEREWPDIRMQFPEVECRAVRFDRMVWYNAGIRRETMAQVRELCEGRLGDVTLVGFSKSGAGAMNLALDNPGLFDAVIVFDAPLANEDVNRFSVEKFYPDAAALRPDVPLLRLRAGDTWGETRLVLVSGEGFADEMALFARAAAQRGLQLGFQNEKDYPHHWNAGWLLPALAAGFSTAT